MEENHQDKTESKLPATEDTAMPFSLSLQGQRGTIQLQNIRMESLIQQLKNQGYKVTSEYESPGQLSKVSGEYPLRKTGWDWLQLGLQIIGAIFISVSIIVGVSQFNQQQHTNLQMSIQQQNSDRFLAHDQQEQTTLETYLDRMSDLLLIDHLSTSKKGDPVRAIAEARTFTALRNLDPARKGTLIRFLWEANLINSSDPIISLYRANLNGANLSHAILSGINLSGANLVHADLSNTTLCGADLYGNKVCADLSQANLSKANLSRANMNCIDKKTCADLSGVNWNGANLRFAGLEGVNFSHAELSGVDLSGTDLSYANLSGTHLNYTHLITSNLKGASLFGADLSGAYLNWAYLGGAHLNNASLSYADLRRADLSGTDLTGANLTGAHLRGAYYTTKTMQWVNAEGNTIALMPTKWPQGFNAHAAGLNCVDC